MFRFNLTRAESNILHQWTNAPKKLLSNLNNVPFSTVCTADSEPFLLEPVDGNELLKVVMNFKNKHSSGYDNVSYLLKSIISAIVKPIVYIINNSIKSGISC